MFKRRKIVNLGNILFFVNAVDLYNKKVKFLYKNKITNLY